MQDIKRILIVEDETVIALHIQSMLENQGFEVMSNVTSGEEAVRMVDETSPDLVIMDIFLHGEMDGITAIEEIKTRHNIPFVYLTAHSDEKTLDRAKMTGPFGYIMKPINQRELYSAIEIALFKHDMQKKLFDAQLLYKTQFENSPDLILIIDRDYRIININRSLVKSWSVQELIGQNAVAILPMEEQKLIGEKLRKCFDTGEGQEAIHTIGEGKWVRARIVPMKEKYAVNFVMIISTDITELKEWQDSIEKKNNELEAINEELTSTNEDLSSSLEELDNVNEELMASNEELEQTQKLLMENEKKFHSLFDSMAEGVCMHKIIYDDSGRAVDYQIADVNPAYEKLLGIPRSKAAGAIASEFYGAGEPPYLTIYAEVAETGIPVVFETYFPPMDKHFSISVSSPGRGKFTTIFMDITEKKKNENDLHEIKDRFRAVSETAVDLIFCKNRERQYTYANSAMEKLLNMPALEILGKTPEELFDKKTAEIIFEVDEKCLGGETVNAVRTLEIGNSLHVLHTIQGPNYDTKGNINGISGIVRDITEQKKAEEALINSELRYRTLFESKIFLTYIIDMEGNILLANEKAAELLGENRESIIGKSIYQLRPDRAEIYRKAADAIISTGKSFQYETNFPTPEKEKWLFVTASPLKVENDTLIQVLISDITERKTAEQNLENSLHEKEILLKEIHHRVKNNMQIISSLLNLQMAYVRDKRDRSLFTESQNRIQSIAMVHEHLYRSEDLSNIDFSKYIRELVFKLFRTYNVNSASIEFDIKAENMFIDITRAIPCGMLINELVTNSIKYAFPGKRKGRVKISFKMDKKSNYVLTVEDNGIGIPDKIDFKKSESFGIQLVNAFVNQIDGKLKITRTKGAKFVIKFPEHRD